MKTTALNIHDFSPHLFWDIDLDGFDIENHLEFLVQRVMGYGLMKDWMLIYRELGIDKIAELATHIRELDEKSLYFIMALSGKRKEDFKCFTTQQSNPKHWSF